MTYCSALLRNTLSTTFDPGAPRRSRVPVSADRSRVGVASMPRDVVSRPEPGLGRRRSVAHADDAKVELFRDDDPGVAGREGVFASRLHFGRREYALDGSRPSASPRMAPSMTLSMLTGST